MDYWLCFAIRFCGFCYFVLGSYEFGSGLSDRFGFGPGAATVLIFFLMVFSAIGAWVGLDPAQRRDAARQAARLERSPEPR